MVEIDKEFLNACKDGDLEKVKQLLERGADVNAKDEILGETALMWASSNGQKEVVEFLIEKGADVNAKTRFGNTALMYASEKGHKEVVELLIKKGADINARDEYGWTPLVYACIHKEIVEILLQNGADVNVKDESGKSVLMYAIECQCYEIANLLIEKGADVNVKSISGETALIIATKIKEKSDLLSDAFGLTKAFYNYRKLIIKLLLEKGADVNVKDENGNTALTYALKNQDNEIVELLKSYGAKE
jgi:ankyrin repeat protein